MTLGEVALRVVCGLAGLAVCIGIAAYRHAEPVDFLWFLAFFGLAALMDRA